MVKLMKMAGGNVRCVPVLPVLGDNSSAAGLVDGSVTSVATLPDGATSLRVTTSGIDGRPLDIELIFAGEQISELCLLLQRAEVQRDAKSQAARCAVPCSVGVKF